MIRKFLPTCVRYSRTHRAQSQRYVGHERDVGYECDVGHFRHVGDEYQRVSSRPIRIPG